MPLSMTSPITTQDIQGGTEFKEKVVFRLDGHAGDALVIKNELGMITEDQFKAAKRTLKQVDPVGAAAKLLTPVERQAVKTFVEQKSMFTNQLTRHRMATYAMASTTGWMVNLLEMIDVGIWYKMPLQNVADISQALEQRMRATPEKDLLREFQKALTDPGGLESLGKIVACDMINSNTDRFHPGKGRGFSAGGVDFSFRVLVNIGNVFITGGGSTRSLTGMDFFETQALYRNYELTIQKILSDTQERWSAQYVLKRDLRQKFCRDIVADLNLILSGGKSIAKSESVFSRKKTWLGWDAADRLEKGMIAGAKQVRDGLRQKYSVNAANKPAGLDSRLAALDKL